MVIHVVTNLRNLGANAMLEVKFLMAAMLLHGAWSVTLKYLHFGFHMKLVPFLEVLGVG